MRRLRNLSEQETELPKNPMWGRVRGAVEMFYDKSRDARVTARTRKLEEIQDVYHTFIQLLAEMAAGLRDRETYTWMKRLADKKGISVKPEEESAGLPDGDDDEEVLDERATSLPKEMERPADVAQQLGGKLMTTGNGKPATFSFSDEDGADQFIRMMARDLKVPEGEIEVRKKGMHDWIVSLPPWAFGEDEGPVRSRC